MWGKSMSNKYGDFLCRMNQYRMKMQLTQMEMSDLLGTTQSQFSKMELGKTIVSYDILYELYNTGWDVDYMIIGKEKIPWESDLSGILITSIGESWFDLMEVVVWGIGQIIGKEKNYFDSDIKYEYELLRSLLNRSTSNSILAEIRSIAGITQVAMAEKMGVNIKKYRDLEKGTSNPDAELLAIIYSISNCRPSIFFNTDSHNMESHLMNDLWNSIKAEKQLELINFFGQAAKL